MVSARDARIDAGGGLTDMRPFGHAAQACQGAFGVEIVQPKEGTSRRADEVVQAYRLACFVILP